MKRLLLGSAVATLAAYTTVLAVVWRALMSHPHRTSGPRR